MRPIRIVGAVRTGQAPRASQPVLRTYPYSSVLIRTQPRSYGGAAAGLRGHACHAAASAEAEAPLRATPLFLGKVTVFTSRAVMSTAKPHGMTERGSPENVLQPERSEGMSAIARNGTFFGVPTGCGTGCSSLPPSRRCRRSRRRRKPTACPRRSAEMCSKRSCRRRSP